MLRPPPEGVTVYRDQLNQKLLEQVVTASAVLTLDYDSYDLKKMMKELRDHVEKVTVPYRYPHKMKFVQ